MSTEERRAEIAANLAALRVRVERACETAGRDPGEITVIAITKTFPASDIGLLAELGMTDVGENRDQEAAQKHEQCSGLALRWHFVGQLQRNKAKSVARYADVVHSVDRAELVEALSRAAIGAGRTISALVQVDLDPPAVADPALAGVADPARGGVADPARGGVAEPARGGVAGPARGGRAPGEVGALADEIAAAPGLELGGVMAVAPLDRDPDEAFARLAAIAADLRARHPGASMVSAGMTDDFESAIRHGATHLRIGSALLGRRSAPVG